MKNYEISQRQYWHHQAKMSAQAWVRTAGLKEKFYTNEFNSPGLVQAFLAQSGKALSISRYDIDRNDQDKAISKFVKNGDKFIKEANLPLCLVFKNPTAVVHIINQELGFISCISDDAGLEFVNAIHSEANIV